METLTSDVTVFQVGVERLDASKAPELRRELEPLLVDGARIVLDMSQVQFVDSSGLGVLLGCLRELNALGGDIKLADLTGAVRLLIELVRMHRVFEIHSSTEAAIRAFQR